MASPSIEFYIFDLKIIKRHRDDFMSIIRKEEEEEGYEEIQDKEDHEE